LQLYREEARYLERTAPWIERVGLSYVKQRLVEDADGRRLLAARFLESQKHMQVDPWAERAAGKDASEFAPLHAGATTGATAGGVPAGGAAFRREDTA
jgi:nitrite reductase (NADH) large subunit